MTFWRRRAILAGVWSDDDGVQEFGEEVWKLAAEGCDCEGCEKLTGRHLRMAAQDCSRWHVAVGIKLGRAYEP